MLLSDDYLQADGTLSLPSVTVGTTPHASSGRFAFFSGDGTQLHVLGEATTAPLVNNQVLVTFSF